MKAICNGDPIRCYDDGSGLWWVYLESFGPVGVIRAANVERAWELTVDEIMDDAETSDLMEFGELPEGCHWRSGMPTTEGFVELIARADGNASLLCRLYGPEFRGFGGQWKIVISEDTDAGKEGESR